MFEQLIDEFMLVTCNLILAIQIVLQDTEINRKLELVRVYIIINGGFKIMLNHLRLYARLESRLLNESTVYGAVFSDRLQYCA